MGTKRGLIKTDSYLLQNPALVRYWSRCPAWHLCRATERVRSFPLTFIGLQMD